MIRNNGSDITVQFSGTVPEKQLPETMVIAAYHNGHPLSSVPPVERAFHAELPTLLSDEGLDISAGVWVVKRCEVEDDSLKEQCTVSVRA